MKVGIVARAGTASLAPFYDDDWVLWGIPWVKYPRIDAVFEIHSQKVWDAAGRDQVKDDGGARNTEATVYTLPCRKWAFPGDDVRLFPMNTVLGDFPGAPFENTICYQMAFALMMGAEEIGLWGVHMITEKEYLMERASVLYWVGLAEGRGVKVTLAPGAPLFMSRWQSGRYGVDGKKRF